MKASEIKDPFKESRTGRGTLRCPFGDESMPLVLRHREIRQTAKDWKNFSSDAPMRVVVPSEEDVRTVRQLPIETDPPLHTRLKRIAEPFFRRPRLPEMEAQIGDLVRAAVEEAVEQDSVEVVRDFALPLQSRGLTYLLGLPMAESERWIAWGVHVFRDTGADGKERGNELEAYIDEQIDRALENPGDDFFSVLTQSKLDGRLLTRTEVAGFANLAFAGGRDTIITLVSSGIAWLAEHPEGLEAIREDNNLVISATEEFVRYFSPLTLIGRVCPEGAEFHGEPIEAGERIALCWASANRDESVFDRPDEVILDRQRNPHVGFGFGAHNCLGASQARLIMRTLLTELARQVDRIELVEAVPSWEDNPQFRRQVGYERLVVRFAESQSGQQ